MERRHRIYTGFLTIVAAGVIMVSHTGAMAHSYIGHLIASRAEDPEPASAPPGGEGDSLKYPVKERKGDFVTDKPNNPFYLPDPSNIKKEVEYDPSTGKYIITEKVGDVNVKEPVSLTYDEYLKYTEKQDRDAYFKSRSNAVTLIEDKALIPPIDMKSKVLDQFLGSNKVEVKPQGNLDVTLGGNYQKIDNPNIPIRNRSTGGFDFDMNINMNVVAKIGDKLQLGLKYNTQSGFDFDNQVKLGYQGKEDDIIKEVALGNVSLALPTRLISGSQSLFGVKTKLQFGRLTWTSVISQQKSKTQSITIDNGALRQNFSLTADQYDENRHFFMAQHFRNNFDYALSSLPTIKSIATVTRLEVWITNRNGTTQNVRDVVALADIGEAHPYNYPATANGSEYPDNSSNALYGHLAYNNAARYVDRVEGNLIGMGLTQGQDYEKTYARKLQPTEYTFNPTLGYLSLNTSLNPNDVLGIAYQYEVNGSIYKVGEFSSDVPPDSNSASKVIYLKLLKGTAARVNLPYYKLMMKNIYSLGAYQVSPDQFILDIYYNDPGGGEKRFIPKGKLSAKPLLKVLNLDNLNTQGDAQPDGMFDFVPGVTIIPQNGRIIFPLVEPFGRDLQAAFTSVGDASIANDYIFNELYDSTKFRAQQIPQKNRFLIKGQYKGSNGSQISLGGINIPKGSVKVTAGGQLLKEGTDYEVDYSLGKVTILNQGVLNSGQQVKIDFENNSQFGLQQRSIYGTRLDYLVNKKFNIGATVIHMTERPFNQKVNIGEDPISNTIFGADIKYETNAPWLTKILDKLPIYSTKEMSVISGYAEVAHLSPGHQKSINGTDGQGQVYVDDFEASTTNYDLKSPSNSWKLASTPAGSPNKSHHILFPEATLINNQQYGMNRAKLAWYRIDNSFFTPSLAPNSVNNNTNATKDPYVRLIAHSEIYPTAANQLLDNNIYSFDLAFYPKERGPYNYDLPSGTSLSKGVNNDGSLRNPETRWGGIMRALDNTDLETSNVEFVEFWMLDPFIKNPSSQGGDIYLHLGNVSEDILKDSRLMMENGLNQDTTQMDSTTWGWVPKLLPLTTAFTSDQDRPYEDVGFDGMNDATERNRLAVFLQQSASLSPAALAKLQADPSSDNYTWFDDPAYEAANESNILHRYKNFNGPDGNTPVQNGGGVYSAGSSVPDGEDLNKDFTLNEDESYFQYRIHLQPGMDVSNNKYIINKQVVNLDPSLGYQPLTQTWYQFRVPIRQYDDKVGSIPDFKSIQFMRVFLTGWQDTTVLRLATLDLIRNQWRTYTGPLDVTGPNIPQADNSNNFFNVGKVNIEENSTKAPVNYVIPPGIQRTYALAAQTNQYVQQNEQSLSLRTCGLADGSSRAAFKNLPLDVRRYKHLKMFVHANRIEGAVPLKNNEVSAFVRLGTDFTDNYYQYEVPLSVTRDGTQYTSDNTNDQDSVWPAVNNVDIDLDLIVNLKLIRDYEGWPKTISFDTVINGRKYSIKGTPDLGAIKEAMLGITNPQKGDPTNPLIGTGHFDDGLSKCAEVWFDEMRLSQFDETGGTAALGEVNIKLADLGNVALTGSMHTAGFGQIEQKIDQRYKDDLYQYSASGTIQLGKLFPEKAGIRLPFYGNITQSFSTPQFDPYQSDIRTSQQIDLLNKLEGNTTKSSIYKAQIQTINTRRGFNFSGVKIQPKTASKKLHIYDPGNFTLTYSYNEILVSDPFIELNKRKTHIGIIAWAFAPQIKEYKPFNKIIKSKTKWLDIIRDFNFNLMPGNLGFNTDMNHDFNSIKLRSLDDGGDIPTTYNKSFKWNRSYTFKYNPFKALSIDYTANNQARIDELYGEDNTQANKDFIWQNIKKGGRNTNYNQTFASTYTLPINKIPVFDFVTANAGYAATYSWIASPQVYDSATKYYKDNPLGNTISNTQNLRGKADLNIKKIYDKVPFLKTYNSPNPNLGDKKENDKKRDAVRKARKKMLEEIGQLQEKKDKLEEELTKAGKDHSMTDSMYREIAIKLKKEIKEIRKQIRQKRKDYRAKQMPPDPIISILVRPLLALKTIGAEYKENKGTTVAGFMPSTNLLGNNNHLAAPGYGFAFGAQPGENLFGKTNTGASDDWLNRASTRGWMSSDTLLNQKFTQNRSQRLDLKASFELFPDFKVDLSLFREYTDNTSELFKVDSSDGLWHHLVPMEIGSYTISYLPVNTFFKPIDNKGFSETYNQFLDNRAIISNRLGVANPNSVNTYVDPTDSTHVRHLNNYAAGYGPKQQDVLIAAFLAAYTHKDAHTATTDVFHSMPVPNWRISYNGLSKIKWLQKIFTSINLQHGYSSTLTVSSFTTNLDAQKDPKGNVSNKDTLSNNFFANYNMPSIVLNEQFSPLIGIDMTFTNKVSARFDYKTSRTLTMSFSDYQLIENKSTTVTVGGGYTVKGLKIRFIKLKGKPLKLENDLKFKLDVSYRDGITINHRIDQTEPQITAGTSTLTISPAVDYMINKSITLRVFVDYSHTTPRVLSSFPTTNVKGGLQLKMALVQ